MLTRQMQVKAVADALGGKETDLQVDKFEEPWYQAYQTLIKITDERKREQMLYVVLQDRELTGEVYEQVHEPWRYPSLQEIAVDLPPIEWLWTNWIPKGMITLLGAVPGAGKSYLALDLARRVICEDVFPDGEQVAGGSDRVIYVDAEVVPQMINERAMKWRMDREKVYLMLPGDDRFFLDFSELEDRETLVNMAYILNPALIVIDSLSSISSKGENSVEDVRKVLGFLNVLAQDMGCGLLLVHHLRKRSQLAQGAFESVTIDSFRGSSHIIAMSRSVLGLSVVQTGPQPDRNGPRCLEVVKTNLARYPESLGVEFVAVGEGVELQYGDAPARYVEPEEMTKSERCQEWLTGLLEAAGEPMSPKDVVELAEEQRFSRATVFRARKDLGSMIVNTDGRGNSNSQWELVK